ncbi:unnamed protein product [Kluyveromyces dobzhanskii CBS 2104]|uniref:WGS project CCBQ000000000 data, contig 00015 n=1 Tax=Kluyveromyces dobzhanskii CBS 2104 TaxID=1427455 RepID=A0A0A8LA55_9SACH|nr:unnamed protein product [Kluyveromyces dobzhanskii CBS 2104]
MTVKNSVCDIPEDFKATLPPRKRAKTQEEKEQRRIERILRNRRAAHQSREKKRLHVQLLEDKCHLLENILKMVDLDTLSEENAKLGGMVEQWRKMQTGMMASESSSTEACLLDSPESLTSSPDKKEQYSNFGHRSTSSQGELGFSYNSSSPSHPELPANKTSGNVSYEHNDSSNYVLGQQQYQLTSTPMVKVEEENPMLLGINEVTHSSQFEGMDLSPNDIGISYISEDVSYSNDNNNISKNGNNNLNMSNQETGDGWNLLLTEPPEPSHDLSEIETSDILSPIGLDTWRNPAVIVT